MAASGKQQQIVGEGTVFFSENKTLFRIGTGSSRAGNQLYFSLRIPIRFSGNKTLFRQVAGDILVEPNPVVKREVFIGENRYLSLVVLFADVFGGRGAGDPIADNKISFDGYSSLRTSEIQLNSRVIFITSCLRGNSRLLFQAALPFLFST